MWDWFFPHTPKLPPLPTDFTLWVVFSESETDGDPSTTDVHFNGFYSFLLDEGKPRPIRIYFDPKTVDQAYAILVRYKVYDIHGWHLGRWTIPFVALTKEEAQLIGSQIVHKECKDDLARRAIWLGMQEELEKVTIKPITIQHHLE